MNPSVDHDNNTIVDHLIIQIWANGIIILYKYIFFYIRYSNCESDTHIIVY